MHSWGTRALCLCTGPCPALPVPAGTGTLPGVPGPLGACAPVRHLCWDAELQSPKPFQLNSRLFPWQGDAAFLKDDALDP